MNLSEHFTLEEMTVSEVAARAGLSNIPGSEALNHLKLLCATLESVRAILGHSIIINSGYRSVMVNRLVGGVPNSAHCLGYAADFICPAFGPPLAVCNAIAKNGILFDQLIFEFNSWTHLSVDPQARRQILNISDQVKGYQSGLVA